MMQSQCGPSTSKHAVTLSPFRPATKIADDQPRLLWENQQRTWIHYPCVHWRRLRWWIGQAELSLNLQAGRTIPTHQSPPIEPCPLGESGLSGKWCLVGGRVHDGMAILGDGIDALSATATKTLLAILCCFG